MGRYCGDWMTFMRHSCKCSTLPFSISMVCFHLKKTWEWQSRCRSDNQIKVWCFLLSLWNVLAHHSIIFCSLALFSYLCLSGTLFQYVCPLKKKKSFTPYIFGPEKFRVGNAVNISNISFLSFCSSWIVDLVFRPNQGSVNGLTAAWLVYKRQQGCVGGHTLLTAPLIWSW